MNYDNFINIPFTRGNLDLYVVRSSILKAINENLHYFTGRMLDIGCGKMPYRAYLLSQTGVKEYTGLDIETAKVYDAAVQPDVTWDGLTMPFQDNMFDTAFGTEVLEHCPDPRLILNETYRVMKPGAYFFFTTPFLWNLHEVPFDEFRYTPFSMTRLLKSTGFKDIQVSAGGGWHTSMAQMLGLWVRRAPMSPRKRRVISVAAKPLISMLMKMAAAETVDFNKAPMINSLYGIARK